MTIPRRSIERYLAYIEPAPRFKGQDARLLRQRIKDYSGRDYQPKSEPWTHQLEGLAFSLWSETPLLYYYMRLGKTRISLEWADMLRGKWKPPALIIAHAPIGLDVWQEQIGLYSSFRAAYIRNSIDEFVDALDQDYDAIVTPWSGLQNMFTYLGKNRRGKGKLFVDWPLVREAASLFELVIMDEIHMAKNHLSLRFQIAAALTAHCRYRMGLTGTPMARSGYALWAEAFLCDRGSTLGPNYYFFEQAVGKQVKSYWKPGKEWKFDRRKLKLVKQKLAPIVLSYELTEVRQVDVRPQVIHLKMKGEQRAAYEEVLGDLLNSDSHEESDHRMRGEFVRLRMVAAGYLCWQDEDGDWHTNDFEHSAKLDWLRSFLEIEWDRQSQLVVFHEYTHTGLLITELLESMQISHGWFYGGTKPRDEHRILSEFRQNKLKVFVANTAKGGAAIDLSNADYLLFFESPLTAIQRNQAEARPLAASRGTRPLLMDDLVCAPVDQRVLDLVREGKDASRELMRDIQGLALDDQPAPPSRRRLHRK